MSEATRIEEQVYITLELLVKVPQGSTSGPLRFFKCVKNIVN